MDQTESENQKFCRAEQERDIDANLDCTLHVFTVGLHQIFRQARLVDANITATVAAEFVYAARFDGAAAR